MKKIISLIFSFIIINLSFSLIAAENSSNNFADNKIIIVDDEPGDADFTSIKEAVNYSSPGDTIEVYSGTYPEQGIHIVKDNITLLGIDHELGEGDDAGKPFIKGNGSESVIHVEASHVIVSNFIIENSEFGNSCIRVGMDWPEEINNITIRDCIIRNSSNIGIHIASKQGLIWNISIINNHINHCKGISFRGYSVPADQTSCIISGNVITDSPQWGISFYGLNCIISGNVITDCRDMGIELQENSNNISGNKIRRCKIGIQFEGADNIIYGNDIESCPVGIQYYGYANIITKNNFKNYSINGFWFSRWFGEQFLLQLRSRWISNYWDTWIGVGPKIILGLQAVGIGYISVIPGFEFDLHPAKEPYDINI